MRTASAWGRQDSGEGEQPGDVMAVRGNTGKASSKAANGSGAWGCHGASPAQRGRSGGRRKNQAGKSLGVRGDYGGREASGVAHESPGVEDKEGGLEASGVA